MTLPSELDNRFQSRHFAHPDDPQIVKDVRTFAMKATDGMSLLGRIIATLRVPENQATLSAEPAGKALVEFAETWIREYDRIAQR